MPPSALSPCASGCCNGAGAIARCAGSTATAGSEHFVRLDINQTATIKKLLLITSNPQLDELFAAVAK